MFSYHLNIAPYISCSEFLGALKNFCLRWKRKLKSTIYGLFLNPNILTVESLNYFYFQFRIMNWKPPHDLVLCKEIIFVNPYSAKKKSIQRSALWQKIAENLNTVKDPCFIVEKRSVRDHIAILIQRFKRQHAQELRESGTTPQHTELDAAIEQIIAIEESSDTEQQEMKDENRGKVEADRKKAEDMYQKALETMGKTQPEQRRAEKMVLGALEYLKERA